MNNSRKAKNRNALSFGLTSLLLISQGLVSVKNASAEVLNRAHGRCLFKTNQSEVFNGHCSVKHMHNNGNQIVLIKLDNGAEYRFRGRNVNSLHVEAWDGIHDVDYRQSNTEDIFNWDTAGDKNRLAVKLDTKHKANASYEENSEDVAGTLIGAAIGGLIGGLISGGGDSSSNNASNNQSSSNQMRKASTGYETILVDRNANFVVGLSKGELIYVNCGDITRINGDKRVAAMDSAGKKGYILTNAVRGVTCNW